MEKKKGLIKNRKLTKIIVFILFYIMLSSSITGGISGSSKHKENGDITINDNNSKLLRNFQNNQIMNHIINKESKINSLNGLFNVMVHTICGEIENSKEVNLIRVNKLDVDNDVNTGIDGKDIEISYIIFPWIELEPDIAVGAIFSITIDRITDDIKDENFTIILETTIGEIKVNAGYLSPDIKENEIPNSVTVSLIVLYYPFNKGIGFKIAINPYYENGNEGKKIVLFAGYNSENIEREFSIQFDPAIETQIEYKPTRFEGKWQYEFYRLADLDSTLTISLIKNDSDEKRITKFVIDKLPKEMSFILELSPLAQGGGALFYESLEMYDTELRIEIDFPGECKYIIVKNTPRKISAEWNPSLLNGFCSIDIVSEKTDFILKDSLVNPQVNLSIKNLGSTNLTASWNLSQPGDFSVIKNKGSGIDICINMYEWIANISSEISSDFFSFSWYLDVTGFLAIDTNWDPLATVRIELKTDSVGIGIIAETMKAEDFYLEWSVSPLIIDWDGYIDPVSMDIYLFLEALGWIQIWGW